MRIIMVGGLVVFAIGMAFALVVESGVYEDVLDRGGVVALSLMGASLLCLIGSALKRVWNGVV